MVVAVSPITVNVSDNSFPTSTVLENTLTTVGHNETIQPKCPSFTEIAEVMGAYLESRTGIRVRKFYENPQRSAILFSLRTPSKAPVEKLYQLYIENNLSTEMTEYLFDMFPSAYCQNKSTIFETSLTINESDYKQYKEVFVTFQSKYFVELTNNLHCIMFRIII